MMTLARPKLFPSLDTQHFHRIVAVGSGLALTVVAAGLYARASWATTLWPWPDVKMTYIFLASVLAAAIAPSIWIGITGEMAILAPGALNTLILNLMFAAYLAVIGLSALLATILLFIYPPTRMRFRSLQNLRRPALLARNAA
jgi:hypothetical protein